MALVACNSNEDIVLEKSPKSLDKAPTEVIKFYANNNEVEKEPYSYFMHKYLDCGLAYFDKWDENVQELTIEKKQDLLNELVHSKYPEPDIETDKEFDEYCNKLYSDLLQELNSQSQVKELKSLAEKFADGGIEEWDDNDFNVCIGGVTYSKLEILRRIEFGIPFEHEIEDVMDDEQASVANGPMKVGKYNLLSLWGKKIRYRNSSCPNISLMKKAMTEWANADNNVIKFVEIKDNGWNRFAWGIGCDYHICLNKATDKNIAGSSTMCCVPWATISMSSTATFGSYLHELGHTLGLVHEQCRPDRDYSVTIHYENIKDGYKSNFHKYLNSSVTVYGDFDFESIMMYPYNAFSKNGQPTITKGQNGTYQIQRVKLSDSDKKYIKNMYY